jgi:hypothetical protein
MKLVGMESGSDAAAARLSVAADRLVNRVGHWMSARWAAPVGLTEGAPIRADVMFALVQALADRAAAAEHRPPQPVPRLDNDLALPDQLRVMVADLLLAAPPAAELEAAASAVESTAASL